MALQILGLRRQACLCAVCERVLKRTFQLEDEATKRMAQHEKALKRGFLCSVAPQSMGPTTQFNDAQ